MSDAVHLELRKCEDDVELRVGEVVAYITEEGTVQLHRVMDISSNYRGDMRNVLLDDGQNAHPVYILYKLYTTIDVGKF